MKKRSTDFALELVASGVLSIDDEGRIWRHSVSTTGGTMMPIPPRRAETTSHAGVMTVSLEGRHIAASRIVWEHVTGDRLTTNDRIAHKNKDKTDNRFSNLEIATKRRVGSRTCVTCREPFDVDPNSKDVRKCAHCTNHQHIAPDGWIRCSTCRSEVRSEVAVSKRFCCNECMNAHLRARRNTLRGRLNLALQRARLRRTCTIDIDWLMSQWDRQTGLCYYTGWEMRLDGTPLLHPSIDRIDSNVGYVPENVVICCSQVNWAKNRYTEAQFIELCCAVARHRG